jgi:hypothetical protein
MYPPRRALSTAVLNAEAQHGRAARGQHITRDASCAVTRIWIEAELHLAPPACVACGHDDEDELRPGLNDDLYCGDCRTTYADHDDAAERRAYAYH